MITNVIVIPQTQALETLAKNRSKSIQYRLVDTLKSGAYQRCKFIGVNSDSELIFKSERTEIGFFTLSPLMLVQRAAATAAVAPTPQFTEGVLKGLNVGVDEVIAVVKWLYAHQTEIFRFGASAPKTISVWKRASQQWELRENSTDLVLLSDAPATPAPQAPDTNPF